MGKKQWKTVAVSVATLTLLSLLVFWVFRDHYQEILQNIRDVSVGPLLFLLGMGILYQLLEAAICMILVRRRLPVFSFSQAVEVVFLGVFGNVSTLSVGSVPMQSYYLHRCGLMAGRGIGTMTLEYVFHKGQSGKSLLGILTEELSEIRFVSWYIAARKSISLLAVLGSGEPAFLTTILTITSKKTEEMPTDESEQKATRKSKI